MEFRNEEEKVLSLNVEERKLFQKPAWKFFFFTALE